MKSVLAFVIISVKQKHNITHNVFRILYFNIFQIVCKNPHEIDQRKTRFEQFFRFLVQEFLFQISWFSGIDICWNILQLQIETRFLWNLLSSYY